ncbi:Plasmid stabilization system [Bathymodiolus thermophilus thioautotrophic gill symbiont]|uniref:Plasmid stabilization system n=1 Tax=Bathymodiolus thermophilus thioautotrophic gill symbiont TaxID=2360 RepID=A0A3G3ILT2_9GAMM|nr:type II toxin-antitoxin system RelE/ParE family toxin [Bathymodiolus thermophilus thioautotrophic gill symbiont]AYQ56755.1 Plasmid stabilization system [Bathymodiolus thermophilus thioautotrophic gill symbiont]
MNHCKAVFSQNAVDGLLEISDYIALDKPVKAGSFVKELTTSLKKTLSIFPYSGKVVENLDLDKEIRIFSHGSYNNYYRVLDGKQTVEVLFIFNASRDIDSLITSL